MKYFRCARAAPPQIAAFKIPVHNWGPQSLFIYKPHSHYFITHRLRLAAIFSSLFLFTQFSIYLFRAHSSDFSIGDKNQY